MADSIECVITRTSGARPPCEGCRVRRFQQTNVRGQGRVYCLTFASFGELTDWLRGLGGNVVLSLFNDAVDTWVDGEPPPKWSIEIIAAALNAQGGPATFTVSADGSAVVTTILNGATSSTVIVAGSIRETDLLPLPQVPEEPSRRQHAPHIGSRLGRRLGVRR